MKISYSGYDAEGKYGKPHDYVVVAHHWRDYPEDFEILHGKNEIECLLQLNKEL